MTDSLTGPRLAQLCRDFARQRIVVVGGGSASMAAVAGTPSITVPVGASRGLPLGLVFMGRAFREGDLIGFAYALEQVTMARRPPAFVPTLDEP